MKQTAMQDLRSDLIRTKETGENVLDKIQDEFLKDACKQVLDKTLNIIIDRIDDELLETEKQQMKEAVLSQSTTHEGLKKIFDNQFEQYYNQTYKSK
jgi:hypothetical protein